VFHLPIVQKRKESQSYSWAKKSNMILPCSVLTVNVIIRDQTEINIWIMSAVFGSNFSSTEFQKLLLRFDGLQSNARRVVQDYYDNCGSYLNSLISFFLIVFIPTSLAKNTWNDFKYTILVHSFVQHFTILATKWQLGKTDKTWCTQCNLCGLTEIFWQPIREYLHPINKFTSFVSLII
jgi:hypothetical protein